MVAVGNVSSKTATKDLEITGVQMGQVAQQRWEWSSSLYLIFSASDLCDIAKAQRNKKEGQWVVGEK